VPAGYPADKRGRSPADRSPFPHRGMSFMGTKVASRAASTRRASPTERSRFVYAVRLDRHVRFGERKVRRRSSGMGQTSPSSARLRSWATFLTGRTASMSGANLAHCPSFKLGLLRPRPLAPP
jgi:hypothetical protein